MGQDNPYIGAMILFAGNFAPRGWALCEGQLLSINQNQALFSILGTIYGGDGRTTFALPDLRGRGPISSGNGPGLPSYRQGSRSGQATHVVNLLELPSHGHHTTATISGNVTVGVNNEPSDGSTNPAGNLLGNSVAPTGNAAGGNNGKYNGDDATALLGGVSIAGLRANVTVNNTGGNQAHNNMQPYVAINYIIALQGVFPSRS